MHASKNSYNTLFLDIGGVLLTNGWETQSRKLAAKVFKIDFEELNNLHRMAFDTYELGKMTLDEYLDLTVFHKKRRFTRAQFKKFMFDQSQPYPEMLEFFQDLKVTHKLRIAAVSNEPKELNEYRIKKFKLNNIFDLYVSSAVVELRKPDREIYQVALGLSGVQKDQVLYIDDREMYIKVAEDLGIKSLHHTSYASTKRKLQALGLVLK